MKNLSKQVRNSIVVGGIAGFSSLTATGTPTWVNLYAAAVAFGLTFFIELGAAYGIAPTKNNKGNSTFFF